MRHTKLISIKKLSRASTVLARPACSCSALQRRLVAASASHSAERISNAARSRLVLRTRAGRKAEVAPNLMRQMHNMSALYVCLLCETIQPVIDDHILILNSAEDPFVKVVAQQI